MYQTIQESEARKKEKRIAQKNPAKAEQIISVEVNVSGASRSSDLVEKLSKKEECPVDKISDNISSEMAS